MDIVVNDTNIFIDLHYCGLLDNFFRLPYRFHTVDFVMAELTKGRQLQYVKNYVKSGILTVREYSSFDEIARIAEYAELAGRESNVSMTDCAVLLYAKELGNARLLTGDKALRIKAENESVNVSGILFVFDELVRCEMLTPIEAAGKLCMLREKNIRLPFEEIDKRINSWTNPA